MKNNWFVSTEKTLEEARRFKGQRLASLVDGCPLRYWPAIVAGPNDGYIVCDLGFALESELPEVK